jgi:hypothetical protein
MMMSSNSNRHTSNSDDTIMEAGYSHRITTLTVLEYPSLVGNWDDELLPSGD